MFFVTEISFVIVLSTCTLLLLINAKWETYGYHFKVFDMTRIPRNLPTTIHCKVDPLSRTPRRWLRLFFMVHNTSMQCCLQLIAISSIQVGAQVLKQLMKRPSFLQGGE